MKHLKEQNTTYICHLAHAWSMGIVLFIHGVIPCILTDWVSKRICNGTAKAPFGNEEIIEKTEK
jgi:hypothetical protein